MKENFLTLENPFYAYLFGLIQADGHLYQNSRNRERLSIELGKRDEELLLELQKRLPFNSTIFIEREKRISETNMFLLFGAFSIKTFVNFW